MNGFTRFAACAALMSVPAIARAVDILDRVDDALTWSTADGIGRARLSGLFDLEEYALPDPAPGLIDSEKSSLFNPRLSLFLDAQWGPHLYAFVQARADHGFDPNDGSLRARLDEYAVRWSPDPAGRFNVQVGKFATVVGSWAERHDSWTNPFITAPLPYENLTGLWDNEPAHSANQLLIWSHVLPGPDFSGTEKYRRIPIIWGPSYAAGAAIAGSIEKFRYAVEIKNTSLSARPEAWREADGDDPTISGRLRYVPNESWELGWSASTGSFLRAMADPLLAPSTSRARYRELVLGHDVSFAWHHLQVWAEVYGARFQMPVVGNADTLAYYVETRYKFAPRFSGAVRWNQQFYGTIENHGQAVQWGHNTWRIDVAPEYRLTPHVQLKVQYSVQRGDQDALHLTQMLAGQFTTRF